MVIDGAKRCGLTLQPVVAPATILVVDDDEAIRQLVHELLLDEGFLVASAGDGEQALGLALTLLPALIVTDLMMPRMDGRALYTALRADPTTAHIPVLLMSAAGQARPGDGFTAFLRKPFNLADLVAEIRRHVA